MQFTEPLAMEHYRLHVIERWPPGPRRDVALSAVRAAIESLRDGRECEWSCMVCGGTPNTMGSPTCAVASPIIATHEC